MAKVKIRHYRVRRNRRAYWEPTATMKQRGFTCTSIGIEGPLAWAKAEELNAQWDSVRLTTERAPPQPPRHPEGSIAEAFAQFRTTHEWARKKPRTREDWERGWKYIEPVFGSYAPSLVEMDTISTWRQGIEDEISLREAHRALKIWRALWQVMATLKYCRADEDPSRSVKNSAPAGRSQTWTEREIAAHVKRAWKEGYHGLAIILALIWDGSVSPVDARTLTKAQYNRDAKGFWFALPRAKTGRSAVISLRHRTVRMIDAYDRLYFGQAEALASAPWFLTRERCAYRKNSLSEDFRTIRTMIDPNEKRQMLDIRRTGAVEALAGGARDGVLSAMLANSIGQSKELERTYAPIQVATVRQAQEARAAGREALKK